MPPETPDPMTLAARLEMVVDRLERLKIQVRGLVASSTVGAKEFVVRDDRWQIRARLEREPATLSSRSTTQ